MACSGATLGRAGRLRTRRDFERVGRVGKRFESGEFLVLVAPARQPVRRQHAAAGAGGRRLGVTVSRKVGNAVIRNRVKRSVREWFRQCGDLCGEGVDVVVIARPRVARCASGEIGRRLSDLLG